MRLANWKAPDTLDYGDVTVRMRSCAEATVLARRGRYAEALHIFENDRCYEDDMAAMSYYALCLGFARKEFGEALSIAYKALRKQFYDPDIYLNIAKICLAMDRRENAIKALRKGLLLDNTHPGLVRQYLKLGLRHKPVIFFLDRSNIINKALGRLLFRFLLLNDNNSSTTRH